jgi:tetratricopeptide (TPR) repeat protein
MPENGTIDIPHVRVHDHKIRIQVSNEEINKIKEFAGIVAINNPDPPASARAEAYINYFEKFGMSASMLDSALKYIPQSAIDDYKNNFNLLVHVYFLKKDYVKVVDVVTKAGDVYTRLNRKSYDNKDAWTAYRIAEAFKYSGNSNTAERFYAKCYELAPLDPSFANEYGEQLASNRKYNEAIRIFNFIIKENPKFAPPYSNLGYLYLVTQNNISKAEELYEKALSLNPDYEAALMNKAALFLATGKTKDGIALLKRVLQIDPANQKAAAALKQLNAR